MKIKSFDIQNFKCLGPESHTFDMSDNILILIGENNVGKSSVMKALNIFFSGTKTLSQDYFINKKNDEGETVSITVRFDSLSEKDKEHPAVKSYISNDNGEDVWVLRKTYFVEKGKSKCDYFAIVDGVDKKHPAGLTQNCDDLFTEEKMQKVYLEAVQEVDTVSNSGKTVFGQIFNLIIKIELEGTKEFQDLSVAVDNYANLFKGVKPLPKVTHMESVIGEKMSRIIKAKTKIDVEIPNTDKILPIPKLLTNDGRDIDIEPSEQGHGLQRALIFGLLELFAEMTSPDSKEVGVKNLILIEEPEIYMHTQMERRIADTLYKIAEMGNAQIICATHSPIFIKIAEKHRALARMVRQADNNVKVIQKEEIFGEENKANKKSKLRMIINFDPTVNEAFFAKRVVLVEGDTEIALFKESAELLDIFSDEKDYHKKRDTTFINCRGKWTINAFQEVLNHLEIDYVVIHDKDEKDEDVGANGKILSLLNNDENRRLMFVNKIEDILGIPDKNKDKPIKAMEKVQELHSEGKLDSTLGVYVRFAYGI